MGDMMRERSRAALPERSDRMAKVGLPGVRKADRQALRAVNGQVLEAALVLMRKRRLKEQAAFFNRDERQVARWFTGEDPIPWTEVLQMRALVPFLIEALAESIRGDVVEIETTIRIRRMQVSA